MVFPLEYVVYVLMAITVALVIWLIVLDRKVSRFLRGGKAETLGESIGSLEKEIRALTLFRGHVEHYLTGVEKRLKRSVQGVGTVRFQAFKGIGGGGNQSFASAFVNEQGEGVVISTIYSRDFVSVYAKPIAEFNSPFELTKEERGALDKATGEMKK